jgi:hypothetical protein
LSWSCQVNYFYFKAFSKLTGIKDIPRSMEEEAREDPKKRKFEGQK